MAHDDNHPFRLFFAPLRDLRSSSRHRIASAMNSARDGNPPVPLVPGRWDDFKAGVPGRRAPRSFKVLVSRVHKAQQLSLSMSSKKERAASLIASPCVGNT